MGIMKAKEMISFSLETIAECEVALMSIQAFGAKLERDGDALAHGHREAMSALEERLETMVNGPPRRPACANCHASLIYPRPRCDECGAHGVAPADGDMPCPRCAHPARSALEPLTRAGELVAQLPLPEHIRNRVLEQLEALSEDAGEAQPNA